MSSFHFYHPIEVRYGDLDPQGHVNNAKYLTYMEQTRSLYIRALGLWDGKSFLEIGIILASAQIDFLAPILYGQTIRVGARVDRLGNKSFTMSHIIEDSESGAKLAAGVVVLVAYDYYKKETVPIPAVWRQRIVEYEGLPV